MRRSASRNFCRRRLLGYFIGAGIINGDRDLVGKNLQDGDTSSVNNLPNSIERRERPITRSPILAANNETPPGSREAKDLAGEIGGLLQVDVIQDQRFSCSSYLTDQGRPHCAGVVRPLRFISSPYAGIR